MKNLIQSLRNRTVDFAIYRTPNSNESHFIGQLSKNRTDQYSLNTDKGFIIHPFDKSNQQSPAVFIQPEVFSPLTKLEEGQLSHLIEKSDTCELAAQKLKCYTQQEYLHILGGAIDQMEQAEIDKFIFSRIELKDNQAEPLAIFEKLTSKYPRAFVYYFHLAGIGSWIGATPEILTQFDAQSLTTYSLAGTQKKQSNPLENYTWGTKEIEEQAYVTRFIEAIFKGENLTYQLEGPRTHEAGPVVHLLSTLISSDATLSEKAERLTKLFHPTPAVCGLPQEKAFQFIQNTELHNRSYYTGFLGPVWLHEKLDLYVNLRCMQVFENYLALHLGGGITKDSEPQKEWQETCDKAQTLLAVL